MRAIIYLILANLIIMTACSSTTVINMRTGEEIFIECVKQKNGICSELFFKGSTIKPFVKKTYDYIEHLNAIGHTTYFMPKENPWKFSKKCYSSGCPLLWIAAPVMIGIHAVELAIIAPIITIKNLVKRRKYRTTVKIVKRLRRKIAKEGVLRLSNKKFDILRRMLSSMQNQ